MSNLNDYKKAAKEIKTNTNTTGTQDNDFNLFPAQVLTNTNTEELKRFVMSFLYRGNGVNYLTAPTNVIEAGVSHGIAKELYDFIDQYVHQETTKARINELERGKRDNLFTAQTKPRVERRLVQLQASLNTEEEK